MTLKQFFPGLLTATLTGTAVVSFFAPSASANPAGARFLCQTSQGVPSTVAITKRGAVPVIHWRSTLGDGVYTPQVRCDSVSKRFQEYYENGTLNFLTTGIQNRLPVVCVARYKGGSCQDLLFTLKPGSNPGRTLQNLMAVRTQSGGPLNESAARVYIDMNNFLETAPVDPNVSATEPSNSKPIETSSTVNPAVDPTPAVKPEPAVNSTSSEMSTPARDQSSGLW